MIFTETELQGVMLIEPERFEDERGFFTRTWSRREFADRGLDSRLVEVNVSFNHRKGTLRGMHYQAAPHGQPKLVRCTKGAVWDVAVDLRPQSATFKRWIAVELTEHNHVMVYIPPDFGHGFITLTDDAEVLYQMSTEYAPASARGVRWNDPAFQIRWPQPPVVISERDRTYPDFAQ